MVDMSPDAPFMDFLNRLPGLLEQGVKDAFVFWLHTLWSIAKVVWIQFWPYILVACFVIVAGVILQIIMIRIGGHEMRLPSAFNVFVGSLTNLVFFFLLLLLAYLLLGTDVIDGDWFAVIEAIAFPATWLFLHAIGFWYR